MLKSVVLHLGAHKTGTSTIQKYMRDNEALCLQNRIGFMSRSTTDVLLRWGKRADVQAHGDELRQLVKQAEESGAEHYVISHENVPGRPFVPEEKRLYPNLKAHAAAVKDELAGWPIKVVFHIRSQPAFLESYYLQTIHEGAHHTFREWRQAMGKTNLSWKPIYKDLCEVFGAENVMIRSFDADIAGGQENLLQQFFAAFSDRTADDFGGFAYKAHRNPSVGDKGLKLALLINPLLSDAAERSAGSAEILHVAGPCPRGYTLPLGEVQSGLSVSPYPENR